MKQSRATMILLSALVLGRIQSFAPKAITKEIRRMGFSTTAVKAAKNGTFQLPRL
jgi:hypothetical protein